MLVLVHEMHVPSLSATLDPHSEHRFPAPSSKGRKDVVNQCLEFGSNLAPKHTRKHETHPPRVKKEREFRLDSSDCGFIYAGVNFVGGYK